MGQVSNLRGKVLIIAEDDSNIEGLSELLEQEFTVMTARDGNEGWTVGVSANPPDLILLDTAMSGKDGFEVCRRLKADEQTRDIPVIFISGRNNEEDEAQGFEVGAVDYLARPFRSMVVQARVRNHIEMKKNRDLLKEMSFVDSLTGVANRRRFDDYLRTAYFFSYRERLPLSVYMIDVDNLKSFNDNFGHREGDRVIQGVARVLMENLRRTIDLVARYGGDEFCCVLPGTALPDAVFMAEKIVGSIARMGIVQDISHSAPVVTVSIGVACSMSSGLDSPEALLRAADRALYVAKETGRNRVFGFDWKEKP